MGKKAGSCVVLILAMLFLFVPATFAANGFHPVQVIAPEKGDAITESVLNAFSVLAGDNVKVQHSIFGTTIVTGNNVSVESDIDGDVIAIGNNITIDGKVDGNLYAAGNGLIVTGSVTKDAFLFGNNLVLEKGSVIGRDVFLFGASNSTFGDVKRDVVAYCENYKLYGSVGRDLKVSAEEIYLADGSNVIGNFNYESKNDALINSGANVQGSVQKELVEDKQTPAKKTSPLKSVFDILFTLCVAAVFWAVLLWIAPRLLEKFPSLLAQKPGRAAGFGAIALVVAPIASIFLLCTVIGIPLALILMVTYAVLLYLAFYITAGAFGIVMFKNVFKLRDLHKNIWYLLSGVLVVKLLTMLPFIGWIFSFATIIFGLGIMILVLIDSRKTHA